MSFTPYGFYIVQDGKCLLSHHFVTVEHNEHLLTGIISALHMLYEEVFHMPLSRISLDHNKILTQPVRGINYHLMYMGDDDQASSLMLEILDLMTQQEMLEIVEKLALSNTINKSTADEFSQIISQHISPDFTATMESVSV